MDCDVIIVGGGPAGLSAALILGRARRRVILCDAGTPRNHASERLGGFLTRDGADPTAFRQLAREELRAYDTVELRENTEIVEAKRCPGGFCARTARGAMLRGRKILLATGVMDTLPPVPGIERFYARSVKHCPYCDGYEQRDRHVAVYGGTAADVALALELTGWTPHLALLSDGPCELSPTDRRRLARSGIALREEPVAGLSGPDGRLRHIVFTSGDSLPAEALFFRSDGLANIELARQLGVGTGPGGRIRTRGYGKTAVPGAFVAGDLSRHVQLAIVAAGEGAAAAFAINSELLKDDLAGHRREIGSHGAAALTKTGTSPGLVGSLAIGPSTSREKEPAMPAKSKAQQKAAGAALAAKRGEKTSSELKGASKSMAKSMSEKELHDMASRSRQGERHAQRCVHYSEEGKRGRPGLRDERSGRDDPAKEEIMSKKTLPVPPANRSDKGPGGDKAAPVTEQMEERQARKSEQDAHNANIKQNTTHQGYQQDR